MDKKYYVHESSYIDNNITIGEGTKIWHFSHILSGSRIGKDCNIGQNVVIGPNVSIGNNCKIQNNVSIFSGVTLENNIFCGPSMVFTNVKTPRCGFPRNTEKDFIKTLVKESASIGANATIVCGVTIGKHSLIGAGTVVVKDVPNYALVIGNPAKQIGWVCRCGEILSKKVYPEEKTLGCTCGRKYRSLKKNLHFNNNFQNS